MLRIKIEKKKGYQRVYLVFTIRIQKTLVDHRT